MIRRLETTRKTSRRPAIGPEDSGRLMTLEDFERARGQPGHVYELIDGVLIVSPIPMPPHEHWVRFIRGELEAYASRHPKSVKCVVDDSEVIVTGRPGPTRPQPDIAAFRDYPDPFPARWDDVCPIVVAEVISPRREKKDTVRNRHLYWMAGGIAEYWIIDPRQDERRPTLIALVRRPGATGWDETVVPFGKSYRSTVLTGFTLNLSKPRRKRAK